MAGWNSLPADIKRRIILSARSMKGGKYTGRSKLYRYKRSVKWGYRKKLKYISSAINRPHSRDYRRLPRKYKTGRRY